MLVMICILFIVNKNLVISYLGIVIFTVYFKILRTVEDLLSGYSYSLTHNNLKLFPRNEYVDCVQTFKVINYRF